MPVIERFGEVSSLVAFEPHLVGRPSPHVISVVRNRLLGLGARLRCSPLVVLGQGLAPKLMRIMMTGAAFMAGDVEALLHAPG